MIAPLLAAGLAGAAAAGLAASVLSARRRAAASERANELLAPGAGVSRRGGAAAAVAFARAGAWLDRRAPPSWLAGYQAKLARARLGGGLSAGGILAMKLAAAAAGACVGGFLLEDLLFALVLGAGAFLLPDLWLSERVAARTEAIERALPDFADLLTLVVEAGLSLDQALARYVESGRDGVWREEVGRALREVRMGSSRADALRALSARAAMPEVTSLVTSIVQAEQMGASVGATLRALAQQMRQRRAQRLEKKAQEAPIRLLFPLMAFILPSVFVVLFGPIALLFLRTF